MSNVLNDHERDRILGLLRHGWSRRRISRETGHCREAITRLAIEAGLVLSNLTTHGEVPTDLPATVSEKTADFEVSADAAEVVSVSSVGRSACEPHREFIVGEVAKGRNAVAIYQDLVDRHGYENSYDAVKRFVRQLCAHEPKVFCRFETAAGEESQVDYGEGAPTRDPRTGKYRKPRLFVLTLGMSRHAFRRVVWNSSQRTWSELHEEAFAYFGGSTSTVRLDNLKEGVLDPDVYDPNLNPLYAAVLTHYGVVALPCRPYAPDLKGKVESAVGYTQRTALKGRRFESLDEQNEFLRHWNERWAATRIHGTTKRQVREMFELERPSLAPLPTTRFSYYQVLERRVHLDGHIEVAGAYYSAPPRYVGSKVIVHAGSLWVRIIDAQSKQCVREHSVAAKGSRRTADTDRPKQTPLKVHQIIDRIAASGASCAAFARSLEAENGALATRSLFGLLDLIRRHGAENVDRACAVAVRIGALRLRFIRTYLATASPPQPLTAQHPLIEEIATYRSHFDALKQGELFHDER
jgi:transposase